MVKSIADFFANLFSVFATQVVLGFGLLLALGVVLFFLQRYTQQLLSRSLGWKAVVYTTGWLGTPIHELSHWLVGHACRIDIIELKLFEPDPKSGVLGYVRYRVPRWRLKELHKVVGTFLMGMAPLFGGSLVLLGLLWLIAPDPEPVFNQGAAFAQLSISSPPAEIAKSFIGLLRAVYLSVFAAGPASWRPWLFLYLAMCIGNHIAPSRADLEGGVAGFATLCGIVLVVDAVALLAQAHPENAASFLAQASGPLSALLLLALVINCGNLALAFLITTVVDKVRRRRRA